MRKIRVSRRATKLLERLDTSMRKRLGNRIKELAIAPTKRAQPLQAARGRWKTQVGGWRIVYRFDAETLWVDIIATRGQVYRDL
jgi:mRNA-degrading endonuclease RelE of RelBE toxin-antitoxin system